MAIPGLRGTDHIGFTVPDIDEADDFFTGVIGCQRVYSLGPYRDDAGTWMADHLNVGPRTVMRELRFYRCGTGPSFEIFQYDTVDPQQPQPRNSDIGGHHLGFYVDDLDAALAHLRSHNVRILGEPTSSTRYSQGQRWVYFLSPWGMQLELVCYPNGKAYEKDSPIKLWNPTRPNE